MALDLDGLTKYFETLFDEAGFRNVYTNLSIDLNWNYTLLGKAANANHHMLFSISSMSDSFDLEKIMVRCAVDNAVPEFMKFDNFLVLLGYLFAEKKEAA